MPQSYTLYELSEYIRRVIALNFPEPIWITCEIAQAKNSRGNIYLDLIQQDEKENVIAQCSAAIWYKSFLFLRSKLGDLLPSLLTAGVQVQIKVSIEYNERYGMKLVVEDIDPSYTLGKLELARQKILERLKQEEVTELNKILPLPSIIQRIAVISAENAAGFIDFQTHLETNNYGYRYAITLFPAALQGSNTELEVCAAIDRIVESKQHYDIVAIIRGGGSKLDLSAFDNFNIGYKIATCPLPVFAGIGHEIDQSISDLMAHSTMKTPTAVADFIIDRTMQYEAEVYDMMLTIERLANQHIKMHQMALENISIMLDTKPREILRNQSVALQQFDAGVAQQISYILSKRLQWHNAMDNIIHLSDPKHTLKKGYTIIRQNDGIISKKSKLTTDKLTIEFVDGSIEVIKK